MQSAGCRRFEDQTADGELEDDHLSCSFLWGLVFRSLAYFVGPVLMWYLLKKVGIRQPRDTFRRHQLCGTA